MPVIEPSTYVSPRLFSNGHVQTIFATKVRVVRDVRYSRERIATSDEDFLDLDWIKAGADRLVILTHGLEGNSTHPYILGMARTFARRGFDILAWNQRSCGGELNRKVYAYHMGATNDLSQVIEHVLASAQSYREIVLIGFSLGGNVTLKYVGERADKLDPRITKAVAFSVPCDVASCAPLVTSRSNPVYFYFFMAALLRKLREKKQHWPDQIPLLEISRSSSFYDFDKLFTVPVFGFKSVEEYWELSSSKRYLSTIAIPTLLVNAADDPMLAKPCFPHEEALASKNFHLEVPIMGGHCGFVSFDGNGEFWSEKRAVQFVTAPFV